MNDTRPGVEERYRAMLLARSPEERLKIGGSMHATARSLVRASVWARNPEASPADLRRALFERFYGHEFGPEDLERIIARLSREPTCPSGAGDRGETGMTAT